MALTLDTLKFVDSIASSPTVRLDLNDGPTWSYTRLDFSPPELRYAKASTLLSDGEPIPAAAYANRVLTLELTVQAATADLCAQQVQNLMRELNRTSNTLQFKPAAATYPVFFRTLRCSAESIAEYANAANIRTLRLSIPAEPFALGLREDGTPVTVTNDPAAGSNGLFFDVSSVKGDVDTPLLVKNTTTAIGYFFLSTRQHGTPSDLPFFSQAESTDNTLGTDTTNTGGAADGTMSGTATTNYVRTSFATTATDAIRVTVNLFTSSTLAQRRALRGTYRVFAVVRRSDASSVITATMAVLDKVNPTVVTIPKNTGRQILDMGLYSFGTYVDASVGYGSEGGVLRAQVDFSAARTSGAGTLDWDCFIFMPADEQLMLIGGLSTATYDTVIDSINENVVYFTDGGDPFNGASNVGGSSTPIAGGWPYARPNQTNRYYVILASAGANGALAHAKGSTSALTAHYWPRYLYPVKPS